MNAVNLSGPLVLNGTSQREWRFSLPDPNCIAKGDEYLELALRCYASGGLSDREIVRRLIVQVDAIDGRDVDRYDAAVAVARHAAIDDLPPPKIVAILAWLAAEIPTWPDADDIASIARSAFAEWNS